MPYTSLDFPLVKGPQAEAELQPALYKGPQAENTTKSQPAFGQLVDPTLTTPNLSRSLVPAQGLVPCSMPRTMYYVRGRKLKQCTLFYAVSPGFR